MGPAGRQGKQVRSVQGGGGGRHSHEAELRGVGAVVRARGEPDRRRWLDCSLS